MAIEGEEFNRFPACLITAAMALQTPDTVLILRH